MSIFVLSPGISSSLSFDIGEKQVRTVFKSDLNLGQVVRPSTLPVIMAVFRPNFSFTNGPTLLYRYSAVSENAVKMIIFSFPGLIGAVNCSKATVQRAMDTLADKGFAAMELDCVWRINPSMVIKGNRRKEKVLTDAFLVVQKEYDEKRKSRKNGKKREDATGKDKAVA